MSLTAGTRLGPYEIIEPAGAGGMGEVYRARDTRLDRTVAVKVLPSHLSSNPDLRQRLEREARAISALSHPNICTLYDIGHQDGVDYLVMEHLEGEPLSARLERGPLPPNELLRHSIEIADALDKAHRQGIIHRDLKPSNIMLTKSGAKLLDFGLAKSAEPTSPTSGLTASPTMASPLTAEGTIVGTFQYMSPEQIEGGQADARSDIFSFGTVLYEMATAHKAFEGKTQASLIGSIMKEEPRPIATLAPPTCNCRNGAFTASVHHVRRPVNIRPAYADAPSWPSTVATMASTHPSVSSILDTVLGANPSASSKPISFARRSMPNRNNSATSMAADPIRKKLNPMNRLPKSVLPRADRKAR